MDCRETRCGALGLPRHHNQEGLARTRVIRLLRRGKGEKGFRMIVIVLLLCDGKVVEVFGIGANWHHKVAT